MRTAIPPKPSNKKGVILLVDNRKDNPPTSKATIVDFRNSAFKCNSLSNPETEVDPLEARPDFSFANEDESFLICLKKKVF